MEMAQLQQWKAKMENQWREGVGDKTSTARLLLMMGFLGIIEKYRG